MQLGHGDAERIVVGDGDLAAGEAPTDEAEEQRRGLINNFTGPSNRFVKMFPDLDPAEHDPDGLANLGAAMREVAPLDPGQDNSDIPAGITYLGQFIDHDITMDKTMGFAVLEPDEIDQGRTPSLDLDSLYGMGPSRNPELYDNSVPRHRAIFKIGATSSEPSSGGTLPGTPDIPVSMPHDLPRLDDGTAIIGDPRNDENLVVAQTHLAFLKFHNRVMATLPQPVDAGADTASFSLAAEDKVQHPFNQARRLVRWHYQWIVLHDFLPRLVDPGVLDDVRTNGPKFYEPQGGRRSKEPVMPLEFSVAAYRLGHSMIRESYNYNRVFSTDPGALTTATLGLLFRFTGGGGNAPIPSNWIIDWRRFFPVGPSELLNFTRRIDTKLVPQLHALPGFAPPDPVSLPIRNLLRGLKLGLPTGQDVAEAMGITQLTPDEVAFGDDGPILRQHGFHERTPLWYYVLKEAELQGAGMRLGEAGSRIVAEVFVGLLLGSQYSFLTKQPDWRPTLPSTSSSNFTFEDLLRFVNEINPIG